MAPPIHIEIFLSVIHLMAGDGCLKVVIRDSPYAFITLHRLTLVFLSSHPVDDLGVALPLLPKPHARAYRGPLQVLPSTVETPVGIHG
jgi:hypothetical protein